MTAQGRCPWAEHYAGTGTENYLRYHDEEWGVPARDELTQFEFLVLEGAQAGLSWSTILNKREGYRHAFDGFDLEKVARYSPSKIETLLQDPGIVRNRLKVESTVSNARACLELREQHGGLSSFLWRYVDDKPLQNRWREQTDLPPRTELSDRISKDLKKLGFRFVGSTIIYAHMQATGMVNDHLVSCYRHEFCAGLS